MSPHKHQLEEEHHLIKLCQQGDRIAFERLFRRYSKDVYSMALRMVYSQEIAEEVTQEVFISVYKDISKFQFQSAFTTWLYRIVYRRAADQFRKISKHSKYTVSSSQHDNEYQYLEAQDTRSNPGEHALENERTRLIEKAISTLSPKQRTIMILRYVHDLSYEEIANVLKCRIGTVKSRLNRAHKTMENKLRHEDLF